MVHQGCNIRGKKIAALGMRIRHGCSYRGLSLNVDMDISPFQGIDACGYPGLEVTQLSEFKILMIAKQAAEQLQSYLIKNLGFDPYNVSVITEANTCLHKHAIA